MDTLFTSFSVSGLKKEFILGAKTLTAFNASGVSLVTNPLSFYSLGQ